MHYLEICFVTVQSKLFRHFCRHTIYVANDPFISLLCFVLSYLLRRFYQVSCLLSANVWLQQLTKLGDLLGMVWSGVSLRYGWDCETLETSDTGWSPNGSCSLFLVTKRWFQFSSFIADMYNPRCRCSLVDVALLPNTCWLYGLTLWSYVWSLFALHHAKAEVLNMARILLAVSSTIGYMLGWTSKRLRTSGVVASLHRPKMVPCKIS